LWFAFAWASASTFLSFCLHPSLPFISIHVALGGRTAGAAWRWLRQLLPRWTGGALHFSSLERFGGFGWVGFIAYRCLRPSSVAHIMDSFVAVGRCPLLFEMHRESLVVACAYRVEWLRCNRRSLCISHCFEILCFPGRVSCDVVVWWCIWVCADWKRRGWWCCSWQE
jgi:hypothetical protein